MGEWLKVVLLYQENQWMVIGSDYFVSSCNSNEGETLELEKWLRLMDNLWIHGAELEKNSKLSVLRVQIQPDLYEQGKVEAAQNCRKSSQLS